MNLNKIFLKLFDIKSGFLPYISRGGEKGSSYKRFIYYITGLMTERNIADKVIVYEGGYKDGIF